MFLELTKENSNYWNEKTHEEPNIDRQEDNQKWNSKILTKSSSCDEVKIEISKGCIEQRFEPLLYFIVLFEFSKGSFCHSCKHNKINDIERKEQTDFCDQSLNNTYEFTQCFIISDKVDNSDPKHDNSKYQKVRFFSVSWRIIQTIYDRFFIPGHNIVAFRYRVFQIPWEGY